MKNIKFILLIFSLIFIQACVSIRSGHYDTLSPLAIDGGWVETKCTCAGKDTSNSNLQYSHVMFINGNKLFQVQIARWKNPEWNHYCSIHEEASINATSDNVFDVTAAEGRTFSAGNTKCDTSMNISSRTWTIVTINKSELKFESTSGCSKGPLTCSFSRLDR